MKSCKKMNSQKLRDEQARLIREIKNEAEFIAPKSVIVFDNRRPLYTGEFFTTKDKLNGEHYIIKSISNGDTLTLVCSAFKEIDVKVTDLDDNELYTLAFILDELQCNNVTVLQYENNEY
jgi:hypothetical protein